VAALLLFTVAAFAWVRPGKGGAALHFTRADVQWLFPAPLTRRQLMEYAVLRSQLTALFSAAILTLFVGPADLAGRAIFFVGFWISSAAVSLHLAGVSLSRGTAVRPGFAGRLRRWVPFVLVAGAVLTIAAAAAAAWPGIAASRGMGATAEALHSALSRGPAAVVLWPFQLLARLTLAPSFSASLEALPAALVLLIANLIWVLRSNTPFEEASAERAERVARLAGTRAAAPRPSTRRSPPFALAPVGRPEIALLWKNLILLGRFSRAGLIAIVVPIVVVGVVARAAAADTGHGAFIVFVFVSIVAVTMGPMMLRNDLRQDLAHIAVLKTWPIRGVSIVLGELLAPAAVLSAVAWLAIAAAALAAGDSVVRAVAAGGATRLSAALAAMLIAPALIFTQLVVHNGLAILFPAWARIGHARAAGVEMMGQSMLMMVGVMLAVGGALIPAVLLATLAGFVLHAAVGAAPVMVTAAVLAAVLVGECLLAVAALGSALDRTDISAVDAAA
jgi:hypothetical protein